LKDLLVLPGNFFRMDLPSLWLALGAIDSDAGKSPPRHLEHAIFAERQHPQIWRRLFDVLKSLSQTILARCMLPHRLANRWSVFSVPPTQFTSVRTSGRSQSYGWIYGVRRAITVG
jgi:hypothetical protein